ncbi:hypothetical protein GALMADRAFT_458564 [Galerina marginata CBS 339.88]|uniref:Anti-proliferative protein domain-containing protein n=1 Tax=Galerina marginata (strain CBS 339.88) TaxID=685588 RepID=A0A067T142_GALM3|nr:hypothetical protein GALMADRAFT_458564 [Galerina marginata CBS 339.88]
MASINASSATMVPASITQAIGFLTRPLILTQSPELVNSLKSVLRTTLHSYFNPARDARLTLSLSTASLPPRPIFAACIAAGLHWAVWMRLLGGRDFTLAIEAHIVSVTYLGPQPQTVVVWSEATLTPAKRALLARLNVGTEPQVPISKLGQQSAMQASLRATVNSALARAQTRTLAQQLLESDHKEEADEIFAMISRSAILSPTPTRESFPVDIATPFMPFSTSFPSPLSSPEPASPDSSRPSSRSSTFSTYFSDDESVTSASSAASIDFLASTKPSSPARPFNRNAAAFVPRQSPSVFTDNTKKDVTKYLYQGGVSTVLTGGVMLGGGPPAAKAKADTVPKYRAPIGGKRLSSPTQNAASANSSWRRAPRV